MEGKRTGGGAGAAVVELEIELGSDAGKGGRALGHDVDAGLVADAAVARRRRGVASLQRVAGAGALRPDERLDRREERQLIGAPVQTGRADDGVGADGETRKTN